MPRWKQRRPWQQEFATEAGIGIAVAFKSFEPSSGPSWKLAFYMLTLLQTRGAHAGGS